MLYRVLLCIAMLTVIYGCANQQKDDTEQETVKADTALTVPTEEVSLNITGMV